MSFYLFQGCQSAILKPGISADPKQRLAAHRKRRGEQLAILLQVPDSVFHFHGWTDYQFEQAVLLATSQWASDVETEYRLPNACTYYVLGDATERLVLGLYQLGLLKFSGAVAHNPTSHDAVKRFMDWSQAGWMWSKVVSGLTEMRFGCDPNTTVSGPTMDALSDPLRRYLPLTMPHIDPPEQCVDWFLSILDWEKHPHLGPGGLGMPSGPTTGRVLPLFEYRH